MKLYLSPWPPFCTVSAILQQNIIFKGVSSSSDSADWTKDLCCRLGGPLSSGLLVKGRMEWRRFCKCFGTSLSCPWRWLAARQWKTSTDPTCKPKPKGSPPECNGSGFETTTICRPSNCTIDLHRRPNDSSDCWTVVKSLHPIRLLTPKISLGLPEGTFLFN